MGNRLKEVRLAKEVNQTELARRCDVTRQTIHAIEAEKYTPSVDLALRISRELKTKLEKIFYLEDEHE